MMLHILHLLTWQSKCAPYRSLPHGTVWLPPQRHPVSCGLSAYILSVPPSGPFLPGLSADLSSPPLRLLQEPALPCCPAHPAVPSVYVLFPYRDDAFLQKNAALFSAQTPPCLYKYPLVSNPPYSPYSS